MKLKKLISMVLLASLLNSVIPVASYADELVCFKEEPAKKLLLDISTCQTNTPLLNAKIKLQATEIDGLQKDKTEYKSQSDQFKKLYVDTSNDLQKEKESKPSRVTWFSAGTALGAVLTTVISIFVIKK